MKTYSETQYFSPIIRWTLTFIMFGLMIFVILATVLDKTEEIDFLPIIFTSIIPILVIGMFWYTKLRIEISEKGIAYRLTPIEFKEKFIAIADIEKLALRKQKMFEFGGLGRRRRIFRKQIAYIMNKNYALEILLKSKKKLVFSIENEKQLERFIKIHFSHLLNKKYADR